MIFKKRFILKILLLSFICCFCFTNIFASESSSQNSKVEYKQKSIGELFTNFYKTTGVYTFLNPSDDVKDHDGNPISKFNQSFGKIIMFFICFLLLYLAIKKGFEPLLLIPIGFGGLLANIPIADIAGPDGFLGIIYNFGISTGLFPLIIFMGVGAMTDFGPLLANPKTALLGGAAQFGIFATLIGALALSQYTSFFDFSLSDAAAIGIIGGADGPTAIFLASRLAPDLLGAIAVAAYSYMALVPIIQPPIMRALTTQKERKIKMVQLREVSQIEKIFFPLTLVILCVMILPDATPLIGALAFGNLVKECGVVSRLSDTMQNALINIITIFLGLSVGSKLAAEKFLVPNTLGILVLGLIAFAIGTASGVIMAKIMNKFSKTKINPLIGAAGVSAVPMAARVVNKEGVKEDCTNILLMHAMGPNVAGVVGSAVAAGVLLSIFK
ncbi:glutaconyl-CoA decarboxylase subunit beta [Campylobacter pinnipediorum subsp. pinnipediorum]|uniref:sodium ion-translocating decarboxylase subunit beta n=1 Tax=Campylobacter pinnipediorum TaxID=1965231 RepID=UPI000995CF69|nr:sodium ion-translocating decarboxylase subunit beta [Campylobacter pinnipediorum]OPA78238.1 glutaconyl-CoA decarboxylase subunit beta [Campylobacter pinnipediorum subsp. pinnipediorum]